MGSYISYFNLIVLLTMLLHITGLLLVSSLCAGQDWAETGYNNGCLYEKEGLNRDGPKEFDCPKFVIESTDEIWNMYRDFDKIESYLRKYMTEDWESISPMGEYVRGMDELIRLVNITLIANLVLALNLSDLNSLGDADLLGGRVGEHAGDLKRGSDKGNLVGLSLVFLTAHLVFSLAISLLVAISVSSSSTSS